MKRMLPLMLALITGPAFAQDTRQMDAHEHGVGVLDIAVDGDMVAMEFHAPGADIVGFEYAAETAADIAQVADAIAALGQPFDLFAVPTAAGCTVTQANAELEVEGAHDDDAHEGDAHGEQDHDHGEEDHAEEEKASAASHTEFHAAYQLTCADPSALTEMTFPYFDVFDNAREVEVQIVTGAGAQAFEVTRDAPTLDLNGLF